MALLSPQIHSVTTEKNSDTSLVITFSAINQINVGRVAIVHCATDNDSSAVADGITNRHSLADSQGNTWVKVAEYTDSDGAAGDGVTHSLWYSVITNLIGSTHTLTLTTSAAVTNKIMTVYSRTKDSTSTIGVEQVGVGQGAISASVTGMPRRQYLLIGVGASEGSDNSKTQDADYTEIADTRTGSGLADTEICVHYVARLSFLTSDTCTSSSWTNTNPHFLLASFYEIFPDTDTFSDNFDDNSLDTAKWNTDNASSGSVAETNQRLEATPANSTAGSQAGIITDNSYNLISSSVQVQLVQAADLTNCYTNFLIYSDADNFYGIGLDDGNFEFIQEVGGVFTAPFSTTYDSNVHKHWRLREANGMTYADYSTDAKTWVNFHAAANPIAVSEVKIRLYTYEHTSDATPGSAHFDNLNILTSADAIDTMSDNFNDNSIDTAKWVEFEENSGLITETNQELQYDLANATDGSWAGLYSKIQYNLTGKRVSVKIPASTGTGHSWFDLTLSMEQLGIVDNFFSIGINFETQTIEAVYELGGEDFVITSDPYDNTDDLYISLRESSGTIYWEYSLDGSSWTELHSQAIIPEIPITNLYVVLDDYEFDASTNPNVHKFDDYNILPGGTLHTLPLDETITLVDSLIRTPGKTFSDTIIIVDAIVKTPSRALSESVTIVDTVSKQGGKVLSDAITLVDDISGKITGRALNETITIVDTVNRTIERALSETITLVDSLIKSTSRALSEAIPLVDTFDGRRIIPLALDEVVTLVDSILKLPGKVLSESITLVDSFNRNVQRALTEVLTLVDSVSKQSGRAFSEAITIADSISNQAGKALSEAITVADTISVKITARMLSETITLVDSISRVSSRAFSDSLSVVDSISNQAGKTFSETITVVDSIAKNISRSLSDVITLVDDLTAGILVTLSQALSETITVADSLTRTVGKSLTEVINLRDILWNKLTKLTTTWTKNVSSAATWLKQTPAAVTWTKLTSTAITWVKSIATALLWTRED